MKIMRIIAAALMTGIFAISAAGAEELGGTLGKIRQSGSITLGYRESSMPFSYVDPSGQVIGYSHDFISKVVEAIKRELQMPKLEVGLVAVTAQNRIPLVQNGTIDLECGVTTNNTERRKLIAFSNSLFIATTRLMVRRASGIKNFDDLAGKTVVTIAATTSEQLLQKMNAEKKMGMKIIATVEHNADPLSILQSGQAEAYMMDDVLLHALIGTAWRPSEWIVTGTPQSFEAYGCMMRKGDLAFKRVVDAAIARLMTSGEAAAIYRKWFLSPIPPNGINLNFPMNEATSKLYKHPNDKAFE